MHLFGSEHIDIIQTLKSKLLIERINQMNDSIFRKKNIDKINSPESLNDYVKVTNPSVWFVLLGIIVFLVGASVWATLGKINNDLNTAAEVKNGEIIVYVDEYLIESIASGMEVHIEGEKFFITDIPQRPIEAVDVDNYVLHKGDMESSRWLYPIKLKGTLTDGVYIATIKLEQITPMSYVLN